MGNVFTDMSQDEKIQQLERKVRRLESRLNGGDKMSTLISSLIGMECVVDGDEFYGSRCTILDADGEWVKLIIHEKKRDLTKVVRIDTIDSITLEEREI